MLLPQQRERMLKKITLGILLVCVNTFFALAKAETAPALSFTYHLLQLPWYVLLPACMLFFALAGAIGTYLFRKFIKIKYLRAHNEIVGCVFAILGGFYALILGFVVLLVWESSNRAENNANREGSLARGLYRDIRYFPDSGKMKPLMTSYLTYVQYVVDTEYRAMEQMQKITKQHRIAFNDVFLQLEKIDSKDPRIDQMFQQLNDLDTYRGLRQLDANSEIPADIWTPLILGAFIILLFAMMVDVESLRLHITVNGLLGAFIGLVIYIIIILDHPFTGSISIKPDQYKTILEMKKTGT
jgi:hypothetical protein